MLSFNGGQRPNYKWYKAPSLSGRFGCFADFGESVGESRVHGCTVAWRGMAGAQILHVPPACACCTLGRVEANMAKMAESLKSRRRRGGRLLGFLGEVTALRLTAGLFI